MSYWQKLSRREAIFRMGTLAATLTVSPHVIAEETSTWADAAIPKVDAPGYGTDPILNAPEVSPWPRILSKIQLDQLAGFADFICPGASAAGVPDVLNEWLSAPYPDQQRDRELILPGLSWLETTDQTSILSMIEQIDKGRQDAIQLKFIARLRTLIAGAYFSSPEGAHELGYVGNRPIAGDYPGPSNAAMNHLNELLDQLGLEL